MKTFSQFIETKIEKKSDNAYHVKDDHGNVVGNYTTRDAAERHKMNKEKGVRK